MSSSAVPAAADRSDLRNVLVSGAKVGGLTAVAVVAYLALFRFIPAGTVREVVLGLLVLAAAVATSLWPGTLAAARNVEGIAGAAAIGLWGAVVFSVIDIAVLRPFKAYPWTWDAIGGGSSWWYIPVWWMLGTFVAWMGGLLTAGRHARGEATMTRIAAPVVIGGVILAGAGKALGCPVMLPVLAGGGFAVALTGLALLSLRKA
ncbi:MAG: hypothetical protein ACM3JP_03165 [Betaproteobacteria bacterium]